MKSCDVIILCGGLGSRLRPLIGDSQKCMAHYDGRPFVFHLLAALLEEGFGRVILALGHDAGKVVKQISSSHWSEKLELIFSVERRPMGTAGAIRLAAAHVSSSNVIVINGDTYSKINYMDLMRCHQRYNADLTVAVTSNNHNIDSGFIRVDERSKIIQFNEKHGSDHQYSSMGVYCMTMMFVAQIPESQVRSLETDIMPNALGGEVYAYRTELPFLDIGTPQRFQSQLALDAL